LTKRHECEIVIDNHEKNNDQRAARIMALSTLNAWERWQAVLGGQRPDRPPISFWRHFYDAENSPNDFIQATIGFQQRFNWDLVKINPKASYYTEPWGVTIKWGNNPLTKPVKNSWPVHKAEDMASILPIPVTHPEFSNQLRAITAIRKGLPRPLPILMTMFSPLSILGDLVPDSAILIKLMDEARTAVHLALGHITKTFSALAAEFLNAGADGLFFATTEWASSDLLSWDQYREYGQPYDLQLLNLMKGNASFMVLHVCASNNYLAKFGNYPAEVVNWNATDPTNLTLRDGHNRLHKPVMGGIDHHKDLLESSSEALADKTMELVRSHADLPFAVGPGCAVPVEVPLEKLDVVKNAVIKAA